jgi:hypothetical protein
VITGVLCGAISFASCSGQLPAQPDLAGPASGVSGAGAGAAASSTEPMKIFNTNTILPGWSKLTRTPSGVSMTMHAENLVAGNAYTVWWVLFNDPGACLNDGCGVDDVFANRGVPSLRFAAGHVLGGSGNGNFGGYLEEANTGGPPCAMDANLAFCGPGLIDAYATEVHLVLRNHGPAIPGLVDEQISSFGGGCQVNACGTVQSSAHPPKPD